MAGVCWSRRDRSGYSRGRRCSRTRPWSRRGSPACRAPCTRNSRRRRWRSRQGGGRGQRGGGEQQRQRGEEGGEAEAFHGVVDLYGARAPTRRCAWPDRLVPRQRLAAGRAAAPARPRRALRLRLPRPARRRPGGPRRAERPGAGLHRPARLGRGLHPRRRVGVDGPHQQPVRRRGAGVQPASARSSRARSGS